MASKENRGFTLVELIVVLAVIGVLAAVLVPNYIKHIYSSKASICEEGRGELAHAYNIDAAVGDSTDYGSIMEGV